MKRISNFVKHTFKHVPKEERSEIVAQVTQILTEKVEDLKESGLTLDQAIDKTVLEFGDASDYFQVEERPMKLLDRIKTIKQYRNDVLFSVFGAIIIIGMLVFTNLYVTGGILWFVLPAMAVLWWPLAIVYRYLNKKEREKDDE